MTTAGRIRLRNIEELKSAVSDTNTCNSLRTSTDFETIAPEFCGKEVLITPTPTPKKRVKRNVVTRAATTTRKKAFQDDDFEVDSTAKITVTAKLQTTTKKRLKVKEAPAGQLRIDNFFKTCSKTYNIALPTKEEMLISTMAKQKKTRKTKNTHEKNKGRLGRKRLFHDKVETETSTTTVTSLSNYTIMTPPSRHTRKRAGALQLGKENVMLKVPAESKAEAVIDLCTEDENDDEDCQLTVKRLVPKQQLDASIKRQKRDTTSTTTVREGKHVTVKPLESSRVTRSIAKAAMHTSAMVSIPVRQGSVRRNSVIAAREDTVVATPLSPPQSSTNTICGKDLTKSETAASVGAANVKDAHIAQAQPSCITNKVGRVRNVRTCPPYKIVTGTTFAVDAFQYRQIEGVTHYFLTHFHADHYIGLTRKFAMPLYVSPLTARLVRSFIPVEEQYLHEIELNTMKMIGDVEVTAIDANHCPGAVMFVFKLANGRCILHTGDFRASPEMESEPIFWNNWIDAIYLDTTYIAHKNNFCTQYESIDRAANIIQTFHEKRPSARVLYICGSYIIGKERFWTQLAHKFGLRVWTEKNRLRALRAMDLEEVRDLLCDDPFIAEMHVLSIAKVSYQSLVEYYRPFQKHFDAVLAFRPSGWEKNGNPPLRGQINIVGIEYSEHSSHAELERFVKYLKPREVISTVPVMQSIPTITPNIPHKWYKYQTLSGRSRHFQPSITSFIKLQSHQKTHNHTSKRTTNWLTPTKSPVCVQNNLSQLSVYAMTTFVVLESDTIVKDTDGESPGTVKALIANKDALEDWMS